MESLKRRIIEEGVVRSATLLDVHSFLNHEVDPQLIQEMGAVFARAFAQERITKVLTIESSGIAMAYATALQLGVPMVFARRRATLMDEGTYDIERVPAFTRGVVTDIVVAKDRILPTDRVLFIDDIIANGDAVQGLVRIVTRLGATIVGAGIAIEKTFQCGGEQLRAMGIPCVSLVQIASLENGQVIFHEVSQH